MQFSNRPSAERQLTRNALIINVLMMVIALPTSALFGYLAYTENIPQLYILSFFVLATFIFEFYILTLIRRERRDYAIMLLLSALFLDIFVSVLLTNGLSAIAVAAVILLTLTIVGQAMSPRYATSGIIAAVIFAGLLLILDNILSSNRMTIPGLESYMPYLVSIIAIPLVFGFSRSFSNFSLQTKITLGILLTGGLTVAVLVIFGLNRFNFVNNFLADKYEENAVLKTEAEISNTTSLEANQIDSIFSETQKDLLALAEYRAQLNRQKEILQQGAYWNASEKLSRLPDGQYGNSSLDPASVYIPNTYTISDSILADLNTSAYLDLIAPAFVESHEEVVALYYISALGYTVYYPNISLAQNVPPDFDPIQQSFYTIAEPSNNPDRLSRLTQPYNDPAGTGLIVTLSAPVYDGNKFEGVIDTDIQLSKVAETISEIKISASGIPLLVDSNGVILAMNDTGYQYFGLQPENIPFNENPKQTIFDTTNLELQSIVKEIPMSQPGLSKFTINGIDTYISISNLESTGYKLIYIAPVSELSGDVIALREDINTEINQTIQSITIILTILFVGAFIASLLVGQVITRPLKRLTETVEQIASGNLTSRAVIETGDESGTLARSFNLMADQLTETLQGLEDRITERTKELETLNNANIYRATRFEAVARISRIISSTRNLEKLLPQLAETISEQLGYYHVGIFLLDIHKENAILVAANSEGGKNMLERGYRLSVNEKSIVGFVTKSGMPRIAADTGQDTVYLSDPDLPETRSEAALPLRVGAESIGALDVQSKLPNAFSEEDINILLSLADQVSIAIQNARSFQESREALERAERAAAQLSEQQWSQIRQGQKVAGFHFDGVQTQELKQQNTQPNNLAVPIILRGVQIGVLKLSAPDLSRKWDDNEVAMAQATAERTALAIETARLLEEAQKRASKERAIGEISAKIGSLVNIENIIQTVIQELGDTLPGTDVAVQFTNKQSEQQ